MEVGKDMWQGNDSFITRFEVVLDAKDYVCAD